MKFHMCFADDEEKRCGGCGGGEKRDVVERETEEKDIQICTSNVTRHF